MIAAGRVADPGLGEVVYLGLGGNVGDRLDCLRRALFALLAHPEITVLALSRVYETEFLGDGNQDPYLNACLAIRTQLSPQVLLAVLKGMETRLGRRPGSHQEPRPLDLDILLYGNRVSSTPQLTLPHPGLRQRAFVLEPLLDLAPDLTIPDSAETVSGACERIRHQAGPWVRPCADVGLLPEPVGGGEEDWRAALAVHCR